MLRVYMYVCMHLLYMWVGGSGRYVCVWHAESQLAARLIFFRYFIFIY